MKQRRVFEAVLFATKAAQKFEDTREDEDKNSFLQKWNKLKTLQQTGEQTPAVSQQIEELLVAIRIPEIGPALHVAAMERFSAKLALLLLEACKDCKDSAAVAAAAAAVMDAQHETMQSCALCDTPAFARSCVEFACSEMVPVMQTAFLLTETDLSADSQSVTDFLHSHLRAACDLEQNKQRVLQVLATPDAESFLERAARGVQKKVAPVLASKLETLRAEVDKSAHGARRATGAFVGHERRLPQTVCVWRCTEKVAEGVCQGREESRKSKRHRGGYGHAACSSQKCCPCPDHDVGRSDDYGRGRSASSKQKGH